MMFMI